MPKYKVYKLQQLTDKMSHIRIVTPMTDEFAERFYFDSSSKVTKTINDVDPNLGIWDDVEFEIIPDNDIGFTDFLYLHDSVIIFSERINRIKLLHLCFYYSGEIIEINVRNSPHKYFLGNVTYAVNMLDKKNCVFGPKDENDQCEIQKYEFINRRTQSNRPLFKLEPDWSRSIYTMQNPVGDIEPDFIRSMKKHKVDVFDYELLYGFDMYE